LAFHEKANALIEDLLAKKTIWNEKPAYVDR
jgi:hypothetical protein